MNIIVNGFYSKKIYPIIQSLFKNISVEYAYLLYKDEKYNLEIKNIDWLHYDQAAYYHNYPINSNQLIPIDEKLIESISSYERIVIKMMDRFEWMRKLNYNQRKYIYLTHLKFWNYVLNNKKINLVIFSNIPHEVYDFTLYALCKIKKIKTIILFQQAQITGTVSLIDDWQKGYEKINLEYNKLLEKYADKSLEEIKLSPVFDKTFKTQLSKSEKPIPFWVKNKTLAYKLKKYFTRKNKSDEVEYDKKITQKIKNKILRVIGKTYKYFEDKIFIRKYYDKYVKEVFLEEKYIYVPLHYQPEMTTCPLANVYVDQYLIVEQISKYLPTGIKIYVKEHPQQKKRSRFPEFYQNMIKLKNVNFVSRKLDTYKLINKSLAVATATGTAGWEAIFRKKPVLLYGYYFYQDAPNVYKIRNNEDCQKAINEITGGESKFDLKKLKIFMKALEKFSVPGYIDPQYKVVSDINTQDNIKNITNLLLSEIKNKV